MIDTAVTGRWLQVSGQETSKVEILATGELFHLSEPQDYVIENAGMTLRHTSGNPPLVFDRQGSFGTGLIGLWRREEWDSGSLFGEEYLYREDGTFSYHGTVDGAYDFDQIGDFTDTGTALIERQLRATLTTGANGMMAQSVFFGPLFVGSYAVAPSGTSWEFTCPAFSASFTRLP